MTDQTSEPKADELVTEEPKRKKFSKFKIILLSIIGFIVLVGGYTYYTTAGASKTGDEFIGYIQAVDGDSAYNLLSSGGKEGGSREQFITLIDQVGPILSGEPTNNGVGISAGTGKATVSTIKYKIPGSDGITYIVQLELVKEDGEWLVLNFDSDPESDSEHEEESETTQEQSPTDEN